MHFSLKTPLSSSPLGFRNTSRPTPYRSLQCLALFYKSVDVYLYFLLGLIPLWGITGLPVEVDLEMFGEKEVVLPFFTGHVARGLLLQLLGRLIRARLVCCMS